MGWISIRSFTLLAAFTSLLGIGGGAGFAAVPVKPKVNETKWLLSLDTAMAQAKKTKKVVLAYFCGSDWEPFCQKLDKDVLDTDMFRAWADENVVLLKIDFPKEKRQSGVMKQQADQLKQRFSVSKSPSFVFLDTAGEPFARAGFEQAKLREDERQGEPRVWIQYADEIVRNRPPDESLVKQKSLADGVAYAKKHFISLLILVSQGQAKGPVQTKADLMTHQKFIRWVNRTMAFYSLEWPEDSDTSADAEVFRGMIAKNNLKPAPLQLLIWDMQTSKIKGRIGAINPDKLQPLLNQIESQLPKPDYNGGWIEDYHLATSISQQQKRYIFLNFTSMDSSEWCQKLKDEVFETDDFKDFAKKNLVLFRADFPTTATTRPQTEALKTQNHNLAEMFNIRGYPSIIIINPLGQRVGEAKYMKGGPGPFLTQMDQIVKKDTERRKMLAGEDQPQ